MFVDGCECVFVLGVWVWWMQSSVTMYDRQSDVMGAVV